VTPPLTIHLFGPLRVTVHGAPLPRLRTHSVEWLLALLTLRYGRAVNRSWLAGTLWPQSSGSRSLQNLRNDLVLLRQALGAESSRLRAPALDALMLDLAGASVDVLQFDASIQAGDEASLRGAVEIYTGPLLEECLEEWALNERAARAEQYLVALEALAEQAEGRGDHDEAIRYLRRAEALDPLRDSLPRRLMTCLAAAGDPAAAIQTYRDFRIRLEEELATVPEEATTRIFHEIRAAARRQAVQRRLASAPSLATRKASSSHPLPEPLPRPLTSLIGRDQEVQHIRAALEQGRLVTLIGGGGVGKTRLALEVALQSGDESPDGAAWVELASLADGALLLPSVAAALGLRSEVGALDADALTHRVVAHLTEGAPLLILDNCEHLLDAAAAVVRILLQRCPELRVLATSRQRLDLAGEVTWRVPSLPAPGPERLPATSDEAVAAALGFAAVRLFVERAAAARPGFRLTSGAEAAAVGQICRRLDGIPLAIELAAARVKVLSAAQIATRLDDRFTLLTRGARGALPRHQTLQALIDWSYDLLSEPEQSLLRQLSVFAGGWTLEATEAVCKAADSGQWMTEYLDLLDSLVDRSLVLVDEAGAGAPEGVGPVRGRFDTAGVSGGGRSPGEGLRYRLLETVREYALEKLAASGELAAVRRRHQAWYLALAERAYAAIDGPEEPEWLTRLEAELDNLRAALAWCQAANANPESECAALLVAPLLPPAAEAGLRLASALWWFWYRRGNLAEGQQWLEAALARGGDLPPSLRAPALLHATYLANARGERETAASLQRATHQEYEKALALARANADQRAIADATLALSYMVRDTLDVEGALRYAGEARQQMEALGDRGGLSRTLAVMAGLALARGDRQSARTLLEELLAICRELGDSGHLVHALGAMGHLERDEGEYARARAFYGESLVLRRDLGHQFAVAQSLEDFAVLAGQQRQVERAIRLLGAAEAFCETLDARPPVAVVSDYRRTVADARTALGEPAFAAAWAEGRALSLDQAIEYALGDL
jgi:predicted ATPase/DNA-binding SARP family transcriptional activator